MGCGESKPEVATGNTILSHRSSEPDPGSKKNKDIETIPEANTTDNSTTNSLLQQQVLEAKNEDNKDLGGAAVAADVKKIDENTATKEGDDEKKIDNGTAAGKEADQKEKEAVKVVGEIKVIKEAESETTVVEKNQNADNQEEHDTADTCLPTKKVEITK